LANATFTNTQDFADLSLGAFFLVVEGENHSASLREFFNRLHETTAKLLVFEDIQRVLNGRLDVVGLGFSPAAKGRASSEGLC